MIQRSEFQGNDEIKESFFNIFHVWEGPLFVYIQFALDFSLTYAFIHLFISRNSQQPRKRQTDTVSFLVQ